MTVAYVGRTSRRGPLLPRRRDVSAADARTAAASRPVLPEWPVYALFCGFPIWWVLGLSAFATTIVAVPMLLLMLNYARAGGQIRAPRSFALWAGFLAFLLLSAVMLDSAARLIGFGVRAAAYLSATILFLYVFNSRMPTRRVVYALVGFWAFLVFGGYLGVLFPHGSFSTPFEKVLPPSIASNEYVQQLVHPRFAEVQQPYGAPAPFTRPSAPLPFTNGWGSNYSLLLPHVLAALLLLRRNRYRLVLATLLAVSILPAFMTLNRGLFLGVGIALCYAALRLALRGRVLPLFGLIGLAGLGALAALAFGLLERIGARTEASSTTEDRLALYKETWRRTLESPIIGYGAPRPSETLEVSVGTQGHIWNLMFSYGLPALVLFLAFVWWAVWRSRRAPTMAALWLHVAAVVGGVSVLYYGYDGPQMAVLLVTLALLLRSPMSAPPPRSSPSVPGPRRR